jgi:plastocyanin
MTVGARTIRTVTLRTVTIDRSGWLVTAGAVAMLCLSGCAKKQASEPASEAVQKPPVNYFHVDPATAGSVSGTIKWVGKPPAQKAIDMSDDPNCVRVHNGKQMSETVVVGPQSGLANVFVYVEKGLEGKQFEPPASDVMLKQTGCWFVPHVLGVQTGQSLEVVNSDPLTHNIHPMPSMNHEWNHSQGPGDPPFRRKFTQAEVMIPIKCKIHGWMHAYVGVVDHPYFAVTDASGKFTLSNLPPGTYTLAAWQEARGIERQTVTIAPGGHASVRFSFQ